MAKRKRSGGGGNWLDTYADMVTLLLTFFVMLFSMSSIEKTKWEALVRSFTHPGTATDQVVVTDDGTGTDIGTNTGTGTEDNVGTGIITEEELNFDTLFEYLEQYVKENNLDNTVEVNEGEASVYIKFSDVVIFDADKYDLRAESYDLLNYLGDALKKVEPDLKSVVIAGHTAWVDGAYKVSDRRLSGQRAASVAIFLQEQKKIEAKKVMQTGYGSNYPIAPNDTEQNRQKNRRVEMMILSNDADLSNEELVKYFLEGTFDTKTGVENILAPGEETTSAPEDSNPPAASDQPTASAPPVTSDPPAE